MPYAKRRKADALNRAYAYLSEPSFGEAAKALVDKLIAMGFDEEEARDSIECTQTELGLDSDLFSHETRPTFTYILAADMSLLSGLNEQERIAVRETKCGTVEIVIDGPVVRVIGLIDGTLIE